MASRPNDLTLFADSFAGVDRQALLKILDFSEEEAAGVTSGLDRLEPPLHQLGTRILQTWDTLGPEERVAALLALANALALSLE